MSDTVRPEIPTRVYPQANQEALSIIRGGAFVILKHEKEELNQWLHARAFNEIVLYVETDLLGLVSYDPGYRTGL